MLWKVRKITVINEKNVLSSSEDKNADIPPLEFDDGFNCDEYENIKSSIGIKTFVLVKFLTETSVQHYVGRVSC